MDYDYYMSGCDDECLDPDWGYFLDQWCQVVDNTNKIEESQKNINDRIDAVDDSLGAINDRLDAVNTTPPLVLDAESRFGWDANDVFQGKTLYYPIEDEQEVRSWQTLDQQAAGLYLEFPSADLVLKMTDYNSTSQYFRYTASDYAREYRFEANFSDMLLSASMTDTAKLVIDDGRIDKDHTWSSKHISQSVAPALQQTVSGAVVAVDDVSPLVHEVGCKVEPANYLKWPEYADGRSKTDKGVTFTVKDDGSIALSGTSTGWADFRLIAPPKYQTITELIGISNGIFTLCSGDVAGKNIKVEAYSDDGGIYTVRGEPAAFDTADYAGRLFKYIRILIAPSTDCTDITVKPAVNPGKSALPYTPYIPDISAVTVSRTAMEYGFYYDVSGNPNKSENHLIFTDYIPLNGGSGITVSGGVPDPERYQFLIMYDANKKRVDGWDGGTNRTIPIGPAWKYLRFGLYVESLPTYRVRIDGTDIDIKPAKTFTPTPDGTVTGMTSLSPAMTILTDNPGAIINAQYNADIKKYIDNAIATLAPADTPTTIPYYEEDDKNV